MTFKIGDKVRITEYPNGNFQDIVGQRGIVVGTEGIKYITVYVPWYSNDSYEPPRRRWLFKRSELTLATPTDDRIDNLIADVSTLDDGMDGLVARIGALEGKVALLEDLDRVNAEALLQHALLLGYLARR